MVSNHIQSYIKGSTHLRTSIKIKLLKSCFIENGKVNKLMCFTHSGIIREETPPEYRSTTVAINFRLHTLFHYSQPPVIEVTHNDVFVMCLRPQLCMFLQLYRAERFPVLKIPRYMSNLSVHRFDLVPTA